MTRDGGQSRIKMKQHVCSGVYYDFTGSGFQLTCWIHWIVFLVVFLAGKLGTLHSSPKMSGSRILHHAYGVTDDPVSFVTFMMKPLNINIQGPKAEWRA